MKTVYCPLKQDQINGIECLEVCDVADHILNPSVLPKEIGEWNEEKRVICKNCKYHADLNNNEEL